MADLRSLFRRPKTIFSDASTQPEAYRRARTNIELSLTDLARPTVMITSPHAGDGKTEVCAQLGRSFAASGRRVVLIDLDLRKPDLHTWVGVENDIGVTDVLLDRVSLETALQYVDIAAGVAGATSACYMLAAGTTVQNRAELLSSRKLGRLLDALSDQADVVLIDAPPVLAVADTVAIGRVAAGTVLVLSSRETTVLEAQQAKDALIRSQTRLLGVILNKVDPAQNPYGYGYGIEEASLPLAHEG